MRDPLKGRALELFFINGRPDGMVTATVFNWTGHVLMFPRTRIVEALARRETSSTGVYILLGDIDGEGTAYIGEAEDLGVRLKQHAVGKDWWNAAALITAGDQLNKAHAKYLEARLVETAREIGAIALDNANTPPRPSLSEAQRSNMEVFLDTLLMVLPALRIDAFLNQRRSRSERTEADTSEPAPVFELINSKHGIKAMARLENGEFVVQAGSDARAEWAGGTQEKTSYWKLHRALCESGVLQPNGPNRVFSEDYAFSSTSAAGAVVNGRSTRGPTAWRLQGTTKTYSDWEAEQLQKDEVAA